ncbi:MAG TPA: TonB-dependent receptor plug domain-containing protein, partial [Steroidobacter sp.]
MNIKNKFRSKRATRTGALITSAVACAMGSAPFSAAQAAEGASADAPLEEVIVTARQREESLLEAPVAVSAITAEQLTTFGARDARDLARQVPSLAIDRSSSGGGGVIVLRGIGSSPSN